jgi:hypothetical protein
LTWFYGDSDPTFASWQGKELRVHIDEVMTNFAITVLQTSYFFEVRSQGCTKARILSVLLQRLSQSQNFPDHSLPSFVLCMSSDKANPTLFHATAKAFASKLTAYKTMANDEKAAASAMAAAAATTKGTVETSDAQASSAGSLLAPASAASKSGAEKEKLSNSSSSSGGMGLASVGVFNCFYGNQKERDTTDADFYVEAESDLRTLLRGIAKLSDSETKENQ